VLFSASTADEATSLPAAVALATLKLGAFVLFTLFAGGRFIPWLLNIVANTHSRELFTLSILAITLGIAVGSTYFFGVSMALGAFLAGMVVGQSDFSARAGSEALPMRDAFAVMFFLSVGMLLDPVEALAAPLMIVATLAIVIIGKPLAAMVIVALLGYSTRLGLGVAISLAQIGEFSFLLAVMGRDLGVLPATAMNPLVTTAILSIMINPMLYRTVPSLEAFLRRRPALWRLLNRGAEPLTAVVESDATHTHQAVVIGYGPIGRTVSRLLRDRGIEPTVVEMNIETFRHLKAEGWHVVYGDASQPDVLEQAGVRKAASIILSSSGTPGTVEIIRQSRRINPEIHVVARADYLGQAQSLSDAGANEVFSGEGEVVLSMTDSILRELGSTPEQLEEERERIRKELFHAREPRNATGAEADTA
jgi:CPA2 family monovalent cation:H+ antiporter-2